MSDLETRKRALVAEAEVYRETLKLQAQNLRIYTLKAQKKLFAPNLANPALLALIVPLASWLLRRKLRKATGWLGRAAFLAPVMAGLLRKAGGYFKNLQKRRSSRVIERFSRV
jgi:hypothetical protein